MTTQVLQVFISATDTSPNPLVVAAYPSTRQVPNDTHGIGMSVYILPVEAIKQPTPTNRVPTLVDNWQSMVNPVAMGAMRVENVFTTSEQIASLHQTAEDTLKYGADISKWPQDARQRKADTDEMWKYVEEVNARVAAHSVSLPHDISSDKVWPTPPQK